MRVLISLLCVAMSAQLASAGFLLVSGDSNIGNPIDGSGGAPGIDPGNATFFTNILGAGTNVLIHDEGSTTSATSSINAINTHYNGLGGVSSAVVSGPSTITAAALVGVDLFVSAFPNAAYAGSEITALNNFLNSSGSVLFVGENNLNFAAENGRINAALTGLGSAMQLGSASIDAGFNQTTNIDVDPLTAGIATFTYAWTNNVVSGGTSLLRTQGTSGGQTFVAYENRMNPIPEASTVISWCLMGATGLGLVWFRRRK